MKLRAVAATRAAVGLAALLRPDMAATALDEPTPGAHPVVRLLGARHVIEAALVWIRPTRQAAGLSNAVDATHVLSCLLLAAVSRRHRTAALRDAIYEVALLAATATATAGAQASGDTCQSAPASEPANPSRWQLGPVEGPHLVLAAGGSAPADSNEGRGIQHVAPLHPGDRLLVGRARDAHLLLPDPAVSPYHLQIVLGEDLQPHLVDLGSANGTCVNGLPVRRAVLHDSDRIDIGTSSLLYRAPCADPEVKP